MKRLLALAVTALLLCNVAAADDYDFFGRAGYPGPVKAPGVDLYEVEQAGGPLAAGYQRRVGVNFYAILGFRVVLGRAIDTADGAQASE